MYLLEKKRMTSAQMVARLAQEAHENPNLICYLRADKDCRYELLAKLFDTCQRNGITIAMATDPKPDR